MAKTYSITKAELLAAWDSYEHLESHSRPGQPPLLTHLISKLTPEPRELSKAELEVLEYCGGHLEQMWAARIAGALLGCNFMDAAYVMAERFPKGPLR